MRCYFVGGALDGYVKEIDAPIERYRVPVLRRGRDMLLADSDSRPAAVPISYHEYRLNELRFFDERTREFRARAIVYSLETIQE